MPQGSVYSPRARPTAPARPITCPTATTHPTLSPGAPQSQSHSCPHQPPPTPPHPPQFPFWEGAGPFPIPPPASPGGPHPSRFTSDCPFKARRPPPRGHWLLLFGQSGPRGRGYSGREGGRGRGLPGTGGGRGQFVLSCESEGRWGGDGPGTPPGTPLWEWRLLGRGGGLPGGSPMSLRGSTGGTFAGGRKLGGPGGIFTGGL